MSATLEAPEVQEATQTGRKLPTEFYRIIAESVEKFPDDIEAANQWAIAAVDRLDCLFEVQAVAVSLVISQAIYDRRHACNQQLRAATATGGPQRARPQDYTLASEVAKKSILDYMIGGMRIGQAREKDLLRMRELSTALAAGGFADMAFCDALLSRLKPGKTVSQSVKEAEARRLFDEAKNRAQSAVNAKPQRVRKKGA